MSRWFRFYTEALDDPKVQRLDGETFKAWVNILCLAGKNGGIIPDFADVAFALRIDIIAARSLVGRLRIAGLIDTLKGGPDGSRIAPHGWHKRQYKSDTSTERVKRFRERSETVTETPPETETETEDIVEAKAPTISRTRSHPFPCPAGVNPQHWSDFRAARRRKRCTDSLTAYTAILRDLQRFATSEWPPGRLVEHAAAKGWASIVDPKSFTEDHRNGRPGNHQSDGIGPGARLFADFVNG